ncbi:MAG: periplasmic heavy metal sensor [Porphyrobacter sp.]|nr:periplasmic heavy metal sensor [Porphyrobacter sp.]
MLGVTHKLAFGAEDLCIGVDEAGRGPLAGPVVAAAVVLGEEIPPGLDDSKRLSARQRAGLDSAIKSSCCWAVGIAEPDEIDRINILNATMLAMTRAVAALAEAIAAEHEYGPRVSDAVDATHHAMGELQKATLEHVFAMRAILRPDQQARFDAVVEKSLAQPAR